jgi:hypothetical protein
MCPDGSSLLLANLHLRIQRMDEYVKLALIRNLNAALGTLAFFEATKELRLHCTDVAGPALHVVLVFQQIKAAYKSLCMHTACLDVIARDCCEGRAQSNNRLRLRALQQSKYATRKLPCKLANARLSQCAMCAHGHTADRALLDCLSWTVCSSLLVFRSQCAIV